MIENSPEILVLMSGGIDSAACLHFYCAMNRPVGCLFVDYGQAAADHEEHAATSIVEQYGTTLMIRRLSGGAHKSVGEIPARNAFLLSIALMERPVTVRGIAIGIHAGTPYPDCSSRFASLIQEVANLQSVRIDIMSPFLQWNKAEVLAYCERERIPIHLTYSCEAGRSPPCGLCNSCLDRRRIVART